MRQKRILRSGEDREYAFECWRTGGMVVGVSLRCDSYSAFTSGNGALASPDLPLALSSRYGCIQREGRALRCVLRLVPGRCS